MASITFNRWQAAKAAERRDEFAELVAEGATVAEAARALGMTYAAGKKLWQKVRKALGPQAC